MTILFACKDIENAEKLSNFSICDMFRISISQVWIMIFSRRRLPGGDRWFLHLNI